MQEAIDKKGLLKDSRWAQNFTDDEVEALAPFFDHQLCKEGEVIFQEGDRQDYLALIVEGRIEILKEAAEMAEKIVVILSKGTHFGELSLIDGCPRSAKARALSDTTLLILPRKAFDAILLQRPQLGVSILHNIAKMISQRLRMTTGQYIYLK